MDTRFPPPRRRADFSVPDDSSSKEVKTTHSQVSCEVREQLIPSTRLSLASLDSPRSSCDSQKERIRLACYLQMLSSVDDPDQFHDLIENVDHPNKYIFSITKPEVIRQVVNQDFFNSHDVKFSNIPDHALTYKIVFDAILTENIAYKDIPERFKTHELIKDLLRHKHYYFLAYIKDHSGLNINYADVIKQNHQSLNCVPWDQQTDQMCEHCVRLDPILIMYVSPKLVCFPLLCQKVLDKYPEALTYIPQEAFLNNPDLVSLAQNNSNALYHLPNEVLTEQFLMEFFQKHPQSLLTMPQHLINKHSEWFASSFMQKLEEHPKTKAFCRKFSERYSHKQANNPQEWHTEKWITWPTGIPESCLRMCCENPPPIQSSPSDTDAVLKDHNMLITLAHQGNLPNNKMLWTEEVVDAYFSQQICLTPSVIKEKIPYCSRFWKLFHTPWLLPEDDRVAIIVKGDTPPWTQGVTSPYMDGSLLLKKFSPFGDEVIASGVYLKKQLLKTGHFKLRNQHLGCELQSDIKKHYKMQLHKLIEGNLPELSGLPGSREIYGGRTFMSNDTITGRCRRFKFLRKGEAIESFMREEAMHRFAEQHIDELNLKSECPKAEGLRLLPADKMPRGLLNDSPPSGFSTELEVVTIGHKSYYLIYEFTTQDYLYSKLAHQKDNHDDAKAAEDGLQKTCHDLGVWASLGVVFTSTIQAYHNFCFNQRELFLACMLSKELNFPGAITAPYDRATNQSDWGYTGLRDWGDCEFYPNISAYKESKNATFQLPGYDQRAAFLNNFFENTIAALLHYARLHRAEPDYNYLNDKCLCKLAKFIEDSVNNYLCSLLGNGNTMENFFESEAIYQVWLMSMAKETVMWTETQSLTKDCYASHLDLYQRYPLCVYPDGKSYTLGHSYPEDFTSHGNDNLGNNHHKFPLTLLTRGLYQVCAGLSGQLQTGS